MGTRWHVPQMYADVWPERMLARTIRRRDRGVERAAADAGSLLARRPESAECFRRGHGMNGVGLYSAADGCQKPLTHLEFARRGLPSPQAGMAHPSALVRVR